MLFFKKEFNVSSDFVPMQDDRNHLYRLFDDRVVFNSILTTLLS